METEIRKDTKLMIQNEWWFSKVITKEVFKKESYNFRIKENLTQVKIKSSKEIIWKILMFLKQLGETTTASLLWEFTSNAALMILVLVIDKW